MANQNFKVKKGLEVGTGVTISGVDGNINISGILTATQFAGDGSALTGVTAAGSGVVVQEEGSNVGTAATINFIGSNVTAALSGGIANVTVSGGSGGLSNVVEDTTPQLGGNLDLNGKNITGIGSISITGGFNATGVSTFQENVVFQSTASFGDNDKINVGAGNDLQIFHDGTSNIIKDAVGVGISLVGNTKVVGVLTATSFSGNGANLTAVDATTLDTFDSSQFLRSDVATTKTSGDLTINDGVDFRFGTGSDLNIGHNGSSSNINQTGTGPLLISNFVDDSYISIRSDNGSGGIANYFQADGSTGEAILYHYGTQKIATKSTGIDVTGTVSATSFSGSGIGLTSIPAGQLTGTVADARLSTVSSSKLSGSLPALDGSALTDLTGASAGTYGASTNTPIITVDSNGRITGISTVATSGAGGGGGISNIIEDTTPQLGGNLDLNSKDITGTGNIDITGYAAVSGVSTFSGAVGFATHIHDAGTGGLDIRTNLLRIKNDADSETLATFAQDGAVSLYHNNALRLQTTGTGVNITDNLNVAGISTFQSHLQINDNNQIRIGDSADLRIYHDGSISYLSQEGSGALIIRNTIDDNDVLIQTDSSTGGLATYLRCDGSNGEVQLGHYGTTKFATKSTGIEVTGAVTGTTIVKSGGTSSQYLMADGSVSTTVGISTAFSNVQATWNVTSSGSSAYRFTGPGNDGTDDNPDLYLVRGQRYRFTNNSGGSHPFQIRSSPGGSAYSTGVTNNGGASGNIDFNVQHDAPSRLYYQCTNHSGMVGNIYIVGGSDWRMTDVATNATPDIFTTRNVGIGTVNPDRQLHVLSSNGTVAHFESSNANTISQIVFEGLGASAPPNLGATGNDLHFTTNNTERLRIDSNGNIIIKRGSDVGNIIQMNGADTTSELLEAGITSGHVQFTATHASGGSNTCGFIFRTRHGSGGTTEKLRITSGGDVRISSGDLVVGETTDSNAGSQTISVGSITSGAGGIQLWGNPTNGNSFIQFGDGTASASHYRGYINYRHADDGLRFGTAGSDRVIINSAGNVIPASNGAHNLGLSGNKWNKVWTNYVRYGTRSATYEKTFTATSDGSGNITFDCGMLWLNDDSSFEVFCHMDRTGAYNSIAARYKFYGSKVSGFGTQGTYRSDTGTYYIISPMSNPSITHYTPTGFGSAHGTRISHTSAVANAEYRLTMLINWVGHQEIT